jgi:hypothetical protein
MPVSGNDVNLANVILQALPAIIALFKSFHGSANPGAPVPTDAQVLAALLQAGVQSIAIDEQWKAAHPG